MTLRLGSSNRTEELSSRCSRLTTHDGQTTVCFSNFSKIWSIKKINKKSYSRQFHCHKYQFIDPFGVGQGSLGKFKFTLRDIPYTNSTAEYIRFEDDPPIITFLSKSSSSKSVHKGVWDNGTKVGNQTHIGVDGTYNASEVL